MKILFIHLFFCIICIHNTYCQKKLHQITDYKIDSANKDIINGKAWMNTIRMDGHRFCHSANWKKGKITFKGKIYSNMVFNYDLLTDEVILFDRCKDSIKYVEINKKFIDAFQYTENNETHHFIKTMYKSEVHFFEELYNGSISFYKKGKKQLVRQNNSICSEQCYQKNQYYFKIKDIYYELTNNKSVFDLLGHEKELKKYARQKTLKIKLKYPNNIISLLHYYDNIVIK